MLVCLCHNHFMQLSFHNKRLSDKCIEEFKQNEKKKHVVFFLGNTGAVPRQKNMLFVLFYSKNSATQAFVIGWQEYM